LLPGAPFFRPARKPNFRSFFYFGGRFLLLGLLLKIFGWRGNPEHLKFFFGVSHGKYLSGILREYTSSGRDSPTRTTRTTRTNSRVLWLWREFFPEGYGDTLRFFPQPDPSPKGHNHKASRYFHGTPEKNQKVPPSGE